MQVKMANSVTTLVRNAAKVLTEGKGFDRVLKNLKVISADKGKCECELTLDESHTNRMGSLHGGLTALLVDNVSTFAILSNDSHPGVSVDLNVTYLGGAKVGDVLKIQSECIKKGKTLAFATVDIKKKGDNQPVAIGRQTKYINF